MERRFAFDEFDDALLRYLSGSVGKKGSRHLGHVAVPFASLSQHVAQTICRSSFGQHPYIGGTMGSVKQIMHLCSSLRYAGSSLPSRFGAFLLFALSSRIHAPLISSHTFSFPLPSVCVQEHVRDSIG